MSVPLVLGDGRACGLDVMRVMDGGCAPDTDRRRRVRVALSLCIHLFRPSELRPVSGKTKNVSCEGFYCYVAEPFTIGERVRCIISFPSFSPDHRDQSTALECIVTVLRSDPQGAGNHGIACQIESYRIIPPSRPTAH